MSNLDRFFRSLDDDYRDPEENMRCREKIQDRFNRVCSIEEDFKAKESEEDFLEERIKESLCLEAGVSLKDVSAGELTENGQYIMEAVPSDAAGLRSDPKLRVLFPNETDSEVEKKIDSYLGEVFRKTRESMRKLATTYGEHVHRSSQIPSIPPPGYRDPGVSVNDAMTQKKIKEQNYIIKKCSEGMQLKNQKLGIGQL